MLHQYIRYSCQRRLLTASVAERTSVDWTKFLEKCSPTVRKTVTELRGRHEELRRLISETRQAIPVLSSEQLKEHYADKLADAPKEYSNVHVEAQEQLRQFKINEVNISGKLKELDEQRQAKLNEARLFLQRLEGEIGALKGQLEKLQNAKPVEEMTIDDVYELYPEWKEKIADSLAKDNWAVGPDAEQEDVPHKH